MQQTIRSFSSLSYIPGLDGIRAIAVIMVMVFHFTAGFAPELEGLGGFWSVLARLCNVGWLGVDIFFVISGFLIARVLAMQPIESFSIYRRFIARRIRRLVPAYVACLLVFVLVASMLSPESKVLRNQYLLWTLTANIEGSFGDRAALADTNFSLVHFWSLAVEWHFYILFPFVLWAARSAVRGALILIVLAIACRLAFVSLGMSDNAVYSFTFCRIDSLAMGVLLAAWAPGVSVRSSGRIALLGAILLGTMMLVLADSGWRFKTLVWLQTFGYSAIAAAVAMILLWVLNATRQSPLLQMLETDWVTVTGRSSYSLYVWHLVFFPFIVKLVRSNVFGVAAQYLVALVVGLTVSAVLGVVSYRWVELRFLKGRSAVGVVTA